MSHTYVVSTIGTSLLTNRAGEPLRKLLTKTANLREGEYEPSDRAAVWERAKSVGETLHSGARQSARDLSAELNGVLGLEATGPDFSHYLLATDTFQGGLTAELVRERLVGWGCRFANIQILAGLTTRSQAEFSRGIDQLLLWCDQTLPDLRKQNARVVFNLAGSFKSLQAFAQTIAMVYADETCYIFEGSKELLRIPRLPIAFNIDQMQSYAGLFARLAEGEMVSAHEAADLAEAYIDRDAGAAMLSRWGKLAWNANKREILKAHLAEQPGMVYEDAFRRDFEKLGPDERVAIQESLAKASIRWREGGLAALRADGGLQYSNMKGHPSVGHFRVGLGPRITCKPDGSALRLRRCGSHEIEKNP